MTLATRRRRLDAELVRRGLATSRTEAHDAIRAGLVTVDGAPVAKPASQVHAAQAVVVASPPRAYVSRGGDKLDHALATFDVDPSGRRCLDAGVSTGGFTDRLLQGGAAHVFAFDVGYGQVHGSLRADPRVTVRERTNVRHLTADDVPPPPPDLLVADVSFISLTVVLPPLHAVMAEHAEAVLLVKPQFEAQRHEVGKGGVVRDPEVWAACLRRVTDAGTGLGWTLAGATASPLVGPAGNVEFLVHLRPVASQAEGRVAAGTSEEAQRLVAAAVSEGRRRRDERHADHATGPSNQHDRSSG